MSSKRLVLSVKGLPKLGLYFSLLVLPGGFVGLLLVWWFERRCGGVAGKGTTWMRYVQMKGWRDLVPAIWRLISQAPKLSIQAPSRYTPEGANGIGGKLHAPSAVTIH
jgi:hypothetical protein